MDNKELTLEERKIFERYYDHVIVRGQRSTKKVDAVKMRDAWNRYNEPKDDYCMCSHFARYHRVFKYLKWFEEGHR